MRTARAARWFLLALAVAALSPTVSSGQTPPPPTPGAPIPTLRILGFAAQRPPGNVQACRQAIAYAIDREAVARATAVHLPQPVRPAIGLQHPALPGFNPGAAGYTYDPARAKELYAECGFAGTVRIMTVASGLRAITAHDEAVAASLRTTLAARIELDRVAALDTLLFVARTGTAAVWILPWVSDRQAVGYPSFALGIGATFVADPDVRALVDRGNARGAEDLILKKALIVPIVYH